MERKSTPPSKKRPYNDYIRYTSLGFQMMATIILGVLIGQWLDGRSENESSLYTLIFTLVSVFIALFIALRGILKK